MNSTAPGSPLTSEFDQITTAHIADACVRLKLPVRCAPAMLRPLDPAHSGFVGRARPTRHYGSVDVFLEQLEQCQPGDVLVIDNGGRTDEACVGDLIALEAKNAGIAALVIWGLHRDTRELREIGLPVFSLGATPSGPLRLDPPEPDALNRARVGEWSITTDDIAAGDEDGVIFVSAPRAAEIGTVARGVRDTERRQAEAMRRSESLRAQLAFRDYLQQRTTDPTLTFRRHLRRLGGAVEE